MEDIKKEEVVVEEQQQEETSQEEVKQEPKEDENYDNEVEQLKKENYELKKEKIFKEKNFKKEYYQMIEKLIEGDLNAINDAKFDVFKQSKDIYNGDYKPQQEKFEENSKNELKLNKGEYLLKK